MKPAKRDGMQLAHRQPAGKIHSAMCEHRDLGAASQAKPTKSASSPHAKRILASELFTTPLTPEQRQEIQALATLPDSEIDYSDAPVLTPTHSEIQIGRFYRSV
jgi:hypothetical protein